MGGVAAESWAILQTTPIRASPLAVGWVRSRARSLITQGKTKPNVDFP